VQVDLCFCTSSEQLKRNADDLFVQGQYKLAQLQYESYIKLNPNDAKSIGLLGHCYYKQGYLKKSQNTLIKAMHCGDLSLATLTKLIEFYQSQNLTVAALNTLRIATVVAPKNTDYLIMLANVSQQQGHTQDAIDAYNQAIAISPEKSELYLYLGNLYLTLNKYQNAIDSLTTAHRLGNLTTSLPETIGDLYYNLAQYSMAKSLYHNLQLNDSIQLKLAQCDFALNHEEQGLQIIKSLLSSKNNYVAGQSHLILASIVENENSAEAITLWHRAVELGVNIETLYLSLAYHYFKTDNYQRAIEHWQKASVIPKAHLYYMIHAYLYLNKNTIARTFMENYIERYGFDTQISQLINNRLDALNNYSDTTTPN
jgi:tetratricopeptide (TPR) repeat protein